jgi:hypothetical protein
VAICVESAPPLHKISENPKPHAMTAPGAIFLAKTPEKKTMARTEESYDDVLGDDVLWGIAAIAGELGLGRLSVQRMIDRDLIPFGRIGGKVVASRRKLREFMDVAVSGNRPAA